MVGDAGGWRADKKASTHVHRSYPPLSLLSSSPLATRSLEAVLVRIRGFNRALMTD